MPFQDENVLRFLRMANIFGADNPVGGGMSPSGPPQPRYPMDERMDSPNPQYAPGEEPFDSNARMKELYNPETTAIDKFYEMANNVPERNKPSMLRKIAAVIAGAGTGNAGFGEDVLYSPYRKQMEEWKSKIDPMQQAANMEGQRNTNERMMAGQVLADERANRNYGISVNREGRLAREGQARTEQNNRKLELAAAKQANPNLVFKVREDGMIIGLHPQTGQPIDTGVSSNELSDLQKIQLGLESRLEAIDAQGAVTRQNQANQGGITRQNQDAAETQRQGNRVALEGTRQANRQALITERNRIWNLLPSQQRQQITNNYEALIRENPALADVLERDPNTGMVSIAEESEPSSGLFGLGRSSGLDKATRDELIRRLNVGVNTPRSSSSTTVRPGDSGPPVGTTKMIGPDNNEYDVPTNKVNDAIRDGMKRK